MPPIQTGLKKNERFVYVILLDRRRRTKPKFQVNDLVRAADLEKKFSKSNLTKWPYKLYKATEIFNEAITSFKINNSKERYNESLLEKTELSIKEINSALKISNLG